MVESVSLSTKKYTGKVKFFNNRHGYGFLTPLDEKEESGNGSENIPGDVFVHFSDIVVDPPESYRTLIPGTVVEFHVEQDRNNGSKDSKGGGRLKAVQVTGPDGVPLNTTSAKPLNGATRPSIKKNGVKAGKKNGTKAAEGGKSLPGGTKTTNGKNRRREPPPPPFHHVISEEVKKNIVEDRGIDLVMKTTVDIAVQDSAMNARIKLGQGGYCGLAQADGVLAEGTYECNTDGVVTFQWEKGLIHSKREDGGGEWVPHDTSTLISSLSLCDERVGPVEVGETPEALWGPGKPDPRESFERHGFQMRKVLLTKPPQVPKAPKEVS